MRREDSIRVAFRVDASPEIGSGHLMRCMALAAQLERRGCRVLFVCRQHPAGGVELARKAGFDCRVLAGSDSGDISGDGPPYRDWLGADAETDLDETRAAIGQIWTAADWVVVDHYGIDAAWERGMRGLGARILAIDDLADRPHDCDVLLDQTEGRTSDDYRPLAGPGCRMLIGADYALLREEFACLRPGALKRRKNSRCSRLLVAMGGYDSDDATSQVLRELESVLAPDMEVDVVLGGEAPHRASVAGVCEASDDRMRLSLDVTDMAHRMRDADVAFGAGGITSWERCCLGLPTVVTALAENQKPAIEGLARKGAVRSVGDRAVLAARPGRIAEAFAELRDNDTLRRRMGENAAAIVDGRGAERVARILLGQSQGKEKLNGRTA